MAGMDGIVRTEEESSFHVSVFASVIARLDLANRSNLISKKDCFTLSTVPSLRFAMTEYYFFKKSPTNCSASAQAVAKS